MNSTSTTAFGFAKNRVPKPVITITQGGQTSLAVVSKFKEMFDFPAVILGRFLGVSDRTAKRKLAAEREFTAEEIGKLIRSEDGFHFVTAIMGDATPEWWRICATLMDAADIRKMQMAAQRRIAKTLKGALDADRALAETISRAEALAVHDEEHASAYIDAVRSMARVPHSAVASSKGRRR